MVYASLLLPDPAGSKWIKWCVARELDYADERLCDMFKLKLISHLEYPQKLIGAHTPPLDFLTIFVVIFTFVIAQSRVRVLTRFTGEDLHWNNLQFQNSWRWLSESIHSEGFFQALFGVVDFSQNTDITVAGEIKLNPFKEYVR